MLSVDAVEELVTEIKTLRAELSRLRFRLEDREGLAKFILSRSSGSIGAFWQLDSVILPSWENMKPKGQEEWMLVADRIREYLLKGEK